MTETVKKQPLLSGLLILFLAAMILANVGNNMFDGLLPLYLKDLDASIPQIGLFFTLAQIAPLLLQILGGWISDSLGRLRAIAIGSVFGVIGFIPLILADTWHWLLLAVAVGWRPRELCNDDKRPKVSDGPDRIAQYDLFIPFLFRFGQSL